MVRATRRPVRYEVVSRRTGSASCCANGQPIGPIARTSDVARPYDEGFKGHRFRLLGASRRNAHHLSQTNFLRARVTQPVAGSRYAPGRRSRQKAKTPAKVSSGRFASYGLQAWVNRARLEVDYIDNLSQNAPVGRAAYGSV